MSVAIVTGSAGLIGSETCKRLHAEGFDIIGMDNDMRAKFFGKAASTAGTREKLKTPEALPASGHGHPRGGCGEQGFRNLGKDIKLVVHTAAQPSHDWAAREPHTDFGVNAWAR